MWMIGSRALWMSSLWVWGKAGLIVWSGPAIQSPKKQTPTIQVARVTETKTTKKTKTWWSHKGRGNVTARDARSLKSRLGSSRRVSRKKRIYHKTHQHLVLTKKLPELKKRHRGRVGPLRLSHPLPGARVGSGYGWRMSPISGKMAFHRGLDYGASYGSKILSAADGVIWRTGWMGSCGLGVVIVHRSGVTSCYCHLSQILAPYRSRVKRGQIIGLVGSTGSSTSPHLHFSVLHRRKFVNPARFLKQ